MTLQQYNSYFESLADAHIELGAGGHFMRGEVEEFFQRFRSDVRFPCLVLEGSEVAYHRTDLPLSTRERTGAFIIADTYGQRQDYDDMQQSLQRCERIAEEMIGRMERDMQEGTSPICSLRAVAMVYLQNQTAKYVGARVEFTAVGPACLWKDNPWTDLPTG